MMFPLYPDLFGEQAWMVTGTLLGVGFGLALEGAGFGRAPNLAAQFYGTDFRVLKVMFGAIVTALLGMTVLSGLGWLDMARVEVPPTFLWAQAVGGLLLGVGFIISGYCPGTAWVSTMSGNLDGLWTILGVLFGSLLFGWTFPWVEGLYGAGAMGVVRLPDLLGLPQAVLAAAVLAMAIGAFLFGEWVERVMARKDQTTPPPSDPRLRNRVFWGLGTAAVVGLGLLAVPAAGPIGEAVAVQVTRLSAEDLAVRLVEDPASLTVVDLRDPAACQAQRVPSALCRDPADAGLSMLASLPPTRLLVLYGDSPTVDLPASLAAFRGTVAMLDGGFPAFRDAVLTEPTLPESPAPGDLERHRKRQALYRHFTGTRTPPPAVVVPRAPVQAPVVRKGGGC